LVLALRSDQAEAAEIKSFLAAFFSKKTSASF
jgi:hypothetical protein